MSSPDLFVPIIVGGGSVSQGVNLTFSYTVQNIGAAAALASAAAYDVDEIPDTGHFLGYNITNALAAGASQGLAGGVSTANLSVGQHTLYIAADNWGQVGESNEGNNLKSVVFTVTAPPQPDLVVGLAAQASVVQGADLSFTYAISNGGTVAAGASAAAYYVDQKPDTGHFLGYNVVPSLIAGGGTQSFNGLSFSTAGLSVGQHTLWVAADNWGQVGESNEANNFNSLTFMVTAPPQPDLVVGMTAPVSVVQGAAFNFNYTILNGGTAPAVANAAAYYVDQKPDTAHFLGYGITNALSAGGLQNLAGGFSTAGLSVGQHTIWVGADNWGQVGESNETNNFNSLTFTVTAPPQPDLIVFTLTVPLSVMQGADYTFTYTIKNTGTATSAANAAAYYVDQKPDTSHFLGYNITSSLAAGGSQNFGGGFSTAGLSVGQHTVWVGADNWGQVGESNEANNWQSLSFMVTAPMGMAGSLQLVNAALATSPDLIVGSITAGSSVVQGAAFNFTYLVQNTGAAASLANGAAYYVDQKPDTGHFLGYGITNALAVGASQTLGGGFSTAGLSVGQHTLWVAADNWNQVAESNETNNFTAVNFTVTAPPLPDLIVGSITASATVNLGANLTFTYAVQNIGAAASLANGAAYYVDRIPDTGHFLGYGITNALAVGASQTLGGGFSTAGLSAGQHFLWVGADNWGQVGESNETNNWTSVAFTVLAPDLVVNNVAAAATVNLGANLTFSYAVQNTGTSASGANAAAYYVDRIPDTGHFLGYGITNTLAVGASQTLGGGFNTAGLSAGQHFLWIGADNWGQVAEGNETNNWTSVAFTVLAPDLVVSNITAAATVNLGANFTFNYIVQNIGTLSSGANAAAYYVDRIPDTGHFLGYGITNTLAVGASQTLGGGFSTAGLSAGQHTLWIGADNWNQVAEGNETNNWTSVTFTILAPDLVVSSITTAGPVGQGGDLTFNYTVQNIGNMTAGASTAAYRIDALPDISHFAGSNPTNALAAGGAQNLAGSVNTAGLSVGQHTLWVETDVANQVAESNENNNWTSVNFTVTAPQLKINLIYDSFAMAAPQSFRDGMQAAANILQAAFHDNITVNIVVGYGEYGNGALALPNQNTSEGNIGFTGGGQFGAGQGVTLSYANLRADLAADAKDGTDTQSVNSLPGGTSLQGHSSFVIGSAQAKALGLLAGNNGAVDGQVGMGTNFTGNTLISGALHELTHAMGRIAGDSLDIFRYNAPGNHVFGGSVPQPASYFSIDGGSTKLADFGRTSDPGDFLNSGVQGSNDPFNESVGNLGNLTSVDLTIMDVLGFDLTQGFHGSAAQIADASAPTSPAPSAGGLDTALLSQYMATIPASPGGGAMGIITPDLMQASNTNPLLAQPHA